MSPPVSPIHSGSEARGLRLLLVVCVVLTCTFGTSKLFVQRAAPPEWVGEALFEGFVSIDGYCKRAELMRSVVRGEPGAAGQLRRDLESLHGTTILVPAAVAALALVLDSIPLSFALLSAAAMLASMVLVGRLAAGFGRDAQRIAMLLFIGHVLTVRSAAQLHMDPFCNLWAVTALLLTRAWVARDRPLIRLALLLVTTTGILIKLSMLPLLAIPAITVWLEDRPRRWRRAIDAGVWFAILPCAVWIAYLSIVLGTDTLLTDMRHLTNEYSFNARHLNHFAVEMLMLFQLSPWLLFRRSPTWPAERPVVVAAALILLSTWGFRLPPIPRLYLPVVSLGAALCAPRLRTFVPRHRWMVVLLAYLALNYAIATIGLLGQVSW